MSTEEMKDAMSSVANLWENFQQENDACLGQVERKGNADSLYYQNLHNLTVELDQTKKRAALLETANNRPALAAAPEEFKSGGAQGEHDKAFRNYLRKGMDAGLAALQTKALSVGSDPDGGYLVNPTMASKIVQAIFETSPMRQISAIETITSDSLDIIDDHTSLTAGWTAESIDITTDTATPTIAKRNIPTNELYAMPKATQKLLDDASIDVEGWLAGKIADIFGRTQNTAFVAGNGVGQPRGFLTYASGTNWGQIQQVGSGSSGQVTADSLITLLYSLKDPYMPRANFMMNRTTLQQVRQLKATTGQYLWQPSLIAGAPDTLLGIPVYMASDMPVASSGSLSVAVGDFKSAYQIVDRQGISILRDPFTEKPFIKFYATARVGGDVVNFEAIKLMVLS